MKWCSAARFSATLTNIEICRRITDDMLNFHLKLHFKFITTARALFDILTKSQLRNAITLRVIAHRISLNGSFSMIVYLIEKNYLFGRFKYFGNIWRITS